MVKAKPELDEIWIISVVLIEIIQFRHRFDNILDQFIFFLCGLGTTHYPFVRQSIEGDCLLSDIVWVSQGLTY